MGVKLWRKQLAQFTYTNRRIVFQSVYWNEPHEWTDSLKWIKLNAQSEVSKSRLSFSEVMNKLLFITFVCVCIYRYKLIIYGLFMLYSLHIWNRNIISFLYCKHKTHSSCICIFFNMILFFVRLECPPLSYSLTTNLSN